MTTNLIITTGDASDADGFLSVAMYARSGADLLFIMNSSAIYNPKTWANRKAEDRTPTYPVNTEIMNFKQKIAAFDKYKNEVGLGYYFYKEDEPERDNIIRLCYYLVSKIWKENKFYDTQTLYFKYKEGDEFFYNDINAFNGAILLNELEVYKSIISDTIPELDNIPSNQPPFNSYKNIYIDGNGSFGFYNNTTILRLFQNDIFPKVQGFFIMGGINASGRSYTKQSPLLNRNQDATMNQVYSPVGFVNFMKDVPKDNIYIITNNQVNEKGSFHLPDYTATITDQNINDYYIYTYLQTILPDNIKSIISDISKLSIEIKDKADFKTQLDNLKSRATYIIKDIILDKLLMSMFNCTVDSVIYKIMKAYYVDKNKEMKLFDVMSSYALIQFMLNNNSIPTKQLSTLKTTMLTEPVYGLTLVTTNESTFDGKQYNNIKLTEEYRINEVNFSLKDFDREPFVQLVTEYMLVNQSNTVKGGRKKYTPRASAKRIKIGSKTRIIYVGKRGTEYVKVKKEFVTVKKALKS